MLLGFKGEYTAISVRTFPSCGPCVACQCFAKSERNHDLDQTVDRLQKVMDLRLETIQKALREMLRRLANSSGPVKLVFRRL